MHSARVERYEHIEQSSKQILSCVYFTLIKTNDKGVNLKAFSRSIILAAVTIQKPTANYGNCIYFAQ